MDKYKKSIDSMVTRYSTYLTASTIHIDSEFNHSLFDSIKQW